MQDSSVRPTDVLEKIISTYGNMLFRYALIMLGNAEDAEDVIQDTLLKYWQKAPEFKDKDHEKAWLLTVVTNRCRDVNGEVEEKCTTNQYAGGNANPHSSELYRKNRIGKGERKYEEEFCK